MNNKIKKMVTISGKEFDANQVISITHEIQSTENWWEKYYYTIIKGFKFRITYLIGTGISLQRKDLRIDILNQLQDIFPDKDILGDAMESFYICDEYDFTINNLEG
jgi:hypothetical protein